MLNKANALGDADQTEYARLLQDYTIAADEYKSASELERSYAADALAREQLAYQKERDKVSDSQWERQFAQSQQNRSRDTADAEKVDSILYNYKYKDKDGKTYFTNPGGKEEAIETGVNPYTRSKNPDVMTDGKYDSEKAFSNGYQPNNVGGKKLTQSGYTDNVNGRTQNVWFDSDGLGWIWDGTQNAYQAYYLNGKRFTRKTLDDKNTQGNTHGRIKEDRYK